MTIEECRKRKREYKKMLQNIELIRLSLLRSIACEDLNIEALKKEVGEMKAKEEADNTIDDLELLIKEVCIPLEQEWICYELRDWDIDEDDNSWCSRNCGKTNSGKCPEMNCYKEWLKMKRKENNNGKL